MAKFLRLTDRVGTGEAWRAYTADAQNAVFEATLLAKQNRLLPGALDIQHSAALVAWGQNVSGSDRLQFELCLPDQIIFGPGDNLQEFLFRFAFKCSLPDSALPFAVWAGPVAANQLQRIVLSGVTPVRVSVISVDHSFAAPITGDPAKMQSAPVGPAEIIWKEPGTGERWAIIRFPIGGGASPVRWAKMDGPWWHGDATDYVFAHPVVDPLGNGLDPSTNLFIRLPSQGGPHNSPQRIGQMPNLRADDVIAYITDADGRHIIAQSYMDAPKSMIMPRANADIPTGWAPMDGSANAPPKGSGIIWDDNRFPRNASDGLNIGGKGRLTAPLPLHSHKMCFTVTPFLATDPASGVVGHRLTLDCTVGMEAGIADCVGPCTNQPLTEQIYTEPDYIRLRYLERIDNSGNPDLSPPPHIGHP